MPPSRCTLVWRGSPVSCQHPVSQKCWVSLGWSLCDGPHPRYMLGFGCVVWCPEAESFFIHCSGPPAAFFLLEINFLPVPWGPEDCESGFRQSCGRAVYTQEPPPPPATVISLLCHLENTLLVFEGQRCVNTT